jgi:hypothetical protein
MARGSLGPYMWLPVFDGYFMVWTRNSRLYLLGNVSFVPLFSVASKKLA